MLNLQCCGTRKPSSKYRLGISSAKEFTTVGRGAGGVDELAASLDESQVMFGLAINVGSGGMARTKYVFVTFLGAKCPMVKRMRATEKRGAAIDACGGGGMIEWEPEFLGCTLDAMLEKVLASVVADAGGDSESMSVSALREQALAEQALHQQELLEQELAAAIMVHRRPPRARSVAPSSFRAWARRSSGLRFRRPQRTIPPLRRMRRPMVRQWPKPSRACATTRTRTTGC